jgi:transcriptional regulator
MARYTLRLFSIAFAACLAAVTYLGDVTHNAVSAIARAAFDLYQPSARETLELDRLVAPVTILPKARSRFLAFVDRLRTHADYSAGHFDPGRMAA